MKKRTGMTLAALVLMFALAACGEKTEQAASLTEDTGTQKSSSELLADGLEYLLGDDTEDAIPDVEEDISQTEKETIQEEEQLEQHIEENAEDMVIYYSNGSLESLASDTVSDKEKTAENIISALARHNIVSLDTKVLSFQEKEIVGGNMLHLDLSKAFLNYLKTMTRESESIIIASLTNTFLENYKAAGIYITIEGEALTTAYGTYEMPMTVRTPEELLQSQEAAEENGTPEAVTEEESPKESGAIQEKQDGKAKDSMEAKDNVEDTEKASATAEEGRQEDGTNQ